MTFLFVFDFYFEQKLNPIETRINRKTRKWFVIRIRSGIIFDTLTDYNAYAIRMSSWRNENGVPK